VYRANQGIDQRGVKLAVVIQRLVDASVAGVLFTANPLTGKRNEAVIESHPGLGEAVVSGAVNPDHYVVDSAAARVVDGPPNGSLTQPQVRALNDLGQRVEGLFGAPQDIEFAFDTSGTAWLVQSRAITTLYPLPVTDSPDLRVYLSFNVAQGVFRPLTPLGIDAFRIFGNSLVEAVSGVRRTTPVLKEGGGRLFLDLTAGLRSPLWRRVIRGALGQGEARSAVLIETLLDDPRLALVRTSRRRTLGPILRAFRRTRLPLRIAGALTSPRRARVAVWQLRDRLYQVGRVQTGASAAERVAAAEQLLAEWPPRFVPIVMPVLTSGVGAFVLAERLLGDLASREERDAVRRALPYNPTTEMDRALWAFSRAVRIDSPSHTALRDRAVSELADDFHRGALPPVLQHGLAEFLRQYGHRAIAEIDIGVPRWSDDPTPMLESLASYQAIDDGPLSPESQFRAGAREADRCVAELTRRAARRGRARSVAVGFLLRRARALGGFREMPKFLAVLLFARVRALLLSAGADLVASGAIDVADDVFFLTFPELREAVAGGDVRGRVEERRTRYAEELRRRHVPRLLLSDGTEPSLPTESTDGAVLRGTPASAGQVTGRARVILDPTGARLEAGDILVAPSTDPGWTPLFLSAAGLVMEMGGAMSHGAVVAREYGIPAVVGVPSASERIQEGEQITVDGSHGTVSRASS
jgi:pyruvate,water dikinase